MPKMLDYTLKTFLRRPATRLYPVEQREDFPGVRGELYNEIEDCIFCKMCQTKCPSQCITVDNKAATWECDPFACVYCGICVEVCPSKCLHMKTKYRAPSREKSIIHMQGVLKKKTKKKKAAAE